MPGIFGGVCVPPHCQEFLVQEFERVWGRCDKILHETGFLGGHAFAGQRAVLSNGQNLVGIDGERSIYRMAAEALPDQPDRIFRIGKTGLDRTISAAGNLAVVQPETGAVYLSVDWSGTFPLYYAEWKGGLIFSSLMRPLAKLVAAAVDPIGTLEFLRQAYTVMGKTLFHGVRRMLPGQCLRFTPTGGVQILEQSRAWVGDIARSIGEATDEGWQRLTGSVSATASGAKHGVLMMSAGWDSRTLLAALQAPAPSNLNCYSHGDVESRELHIVDRICRSQGLPCHFETIDNAVLDLDLLQQAFGRTENVVFPHWHRAGYLLSQVGADCISAGIYGEVLGGHYGPAMLSRGSGKVTAVAASLLGLRSGPNLSQGGAESVRDRLLLRSLDSSWYLDRDFEHSIRGGRDRINADIESALSRLERRGVSQALQLIEAFVTEHRGTHYIAAQLLSCRAYTDVAVPFAAGDMFEFASRLPLHLKIHNRLNRAILRRYAPSLLRHPMAATLVPAAAPIAVQEASRLARKVYAGVRQYAHARTRGLLKPARLGWVNFGFLRSGHALRALADDLKSDIWNKEALYRRISALQRGEWVGDPHPLFDQMMKIYTVDHLLR